ncbi:metal-dependent hydrolase [Fructilactobacillus sp. Tb1]|uniref:metal-dependent hydrolase n=1 Tax=Fructilactobacillus sp. Tb1 TaxID=3422304 RepID=UPI003D2C0C64
MLGKTHLVSSEAIALTAVNYYSQTNHATVPIVITTLLFASVGLGSLLPDVDSRNSELNKTPIFGFIYNHFFINVKHRGFTHTIWNVFLFMGISLLLEPHHFLISVAVFGVSIGILIHIIEDSYSNNKVDIWYPFGSHHSIKHKRLIHYKVGGFTEQSMYVLFWVLLVVSLKNAYLLYLN